MMEETPTSETFADFVAAYAPHIRPPGTEERLRRAFEIDVEFLESFRLLRPYLRIFRDEWAGAVLDHIRRSRSSESAFPPQVAAAFSRIFRRHFGLLYCGKFDSSYLGSVEEVALYMIFRDVKSVWLAGAYQKLLFDITHRVFETSPTLRPKQLERVICLGSKTIAIEMNQIQRVFTVYEGYRLRLATAANPFLAESYVLESDDGLLSR